MLIAGNWKMNTDTAAAEALAKGVVDGVASLGTKVDVAVCPPFVSVQAVSSALKGSAVRLGAQNMSNFDSGAYTGEVAAPMLTHLGCYYVILGHSERRLYFAETDESVNAKVKQAQTHGLVPIVCVGETLEERDRGEEKDIVGRQVKGAFEGVSVSNGSELVVAYEPVWAIGTGRTATPEQAQEMHAFIRGLLNDLFGKQVASEVNILYGGSMNPKNADELLARADIDGGLIGGAALKAEDFVSLVKIANGIER